MGWTSLEAIWPVLLCCFLFKEGHSCLTTKHHLISGALLDIHGHHKLLGLTQWEFISLSKLLNSSLFPISFLQKAKIPF